MEQDLEQAQGGARPLAETAEAVRAARAEPAEPAADEPAPIVLADAMCGAFCSITARAART